MKKLRKKYRFLLIFCLTVLWANVGAQDAPFDELDGKFLYEDFAGCARCHGLDGKGAVEGLELADEPPDFTDCSFNTREPRKDWRAVINHSGTARGLSETMPAYGEALSPEQVEAIIDYIKTFCEETGWPPGELNFRRPQITTKAFPENEAVFTQSFEPVKDSDVEVAVSKFIYERRLGKRSQWEVALPLTAGFGSGASSGVGNIELGLKHVLAYNPAGRSIFSGGVETALPAINSGAGNETFGVAAFLAAAKGFDAFALQSSVKFEAPLESSKGEKELFWNTALTLPLTNEKKGFYPMVEFSGVHELDSDENTLLITPQIYFAFVKSGHIALSLGGQVPVAGHRKNDFRLVAFFLWEYVDGGLWW